MYYIESRKGKTDETQEDSRNKTHAEKRRYEEPIEMSRENSQPNEYHEWIDGDKYNLIKQEQPDNKYPEKMINDEISTHKIKLIYMNLPSQKVDNQQTILLEILDDLQPDILVVTEGYCKLQKKKNLPTGFEYNIYTHERFTKKNAIVLINKKLEIEVTSCTAEKNELEIKLRTRHGNIQLLVIYRTPTRNAAIYKKLKYARDRTPAWEKHIKWLDRRIMNFMAENT